MIVCGFSRQADSHHFDRAYREGRIEMARGKETREVVGRMHVLESPLHADFAFIKAERGDRWGNLNYRKTARNFGPVMAMAARTTVATVHDVVPLGALDP
jgi:3-oxoadipate CoA-transferase alpha subunit